MWCEGWQRAAPQRAEGGTSGVSPNGVPRNGLPPTPAIDPAVPTSTLYLSPVDLLRVDALALQRLTPAATLIASFVRGRLSRVHIKSLRADVDMERFFSHAQRLVSLPEVSVRADVEMERFLSHAQKLVALPWGNSSPLSPLGTFVSPLSPSVKTHELPATPGTHQRRTRRRRLASGPGSPCMHMYSGPGSPCSPRSPNPRLY